MLVHKSGDKSVAFFISYMNLISERMSIDILETYRIQHFFQHDMQSFGPNTLENFKQALRIIRKK